MNKKCTLIFYSFLIYTSTYSQKIDSTTQVKFNIDSLQQVESKSVNSLNRKSELQFISGTSVEKFGSDQFQNSASVHYLQEVAKLRGMNMVQNGILSSSLNSGGFSRTLNNGFLQRFDGVDTQLPDMNFSFANLSGTSELDFQKAEVIPLPSAATYGPYAMNGVLNVYSKDPFEHTGLSALVKLGGNQISSVSGSLSAPLYQLGLRYARNFNDKVALKFNISYFETQDWEPDYPGNDRYLSDNLGSQSDDPGYDGVNYYGDEFSTIIPFGINGADVDVSRTGYPEHELLNYKADNILIDFAAHYRFYKHVTAILAISANQGNTIITGQNRTFIPNLMQTKVRFEINGGNFFLRYYNVMHEMDQSIDTRLLGRNLNLFGKPNTAWFIDFSAAFGGGLSGMGIAGRDIDAARAFADGQGLNVFGIFRDRPDPSDPDFEGVVDLIIRNQVQGLPPVDSEFQTEQQLSHFELFYDFEKVIPWFGAQLGFVSRNYDVGDQNPAIFAFTNGDGYQEQSFYGQLSKKLLEDKINLQIDLRLDDNDVNGNTTSFSFGSSYLLTKNHAFRFSYREGYRTPSWHEQNGFRNIGPGELRGASTELNFAFIDNRGQTAVPLAGNSIFLKNVNEFDRLLREAVAAGVPKNDAALQNLGILGTGILQNGDLESLESEQRNVIELGYRTKLSELLSVDFSGYYGRTENIIGAVGVVRPFGLINPPIADTLGVIDAVRDDRRRQLFWFWQNAEETVESYGLWMGLSSELPHKFYINTNVAWQDFKTAEELVNPGFNTPEYVLNFAFGNNNIWKNLGFQLSGHWQDSYNWYSLIGEGKVDSFFTMDGQLSYKISHLNTFVKFGATNLLQENYNDNFGGPIIGSTYYFSIILEDLLN